MKSLALAAILATSAGVASAYTVTFTNQDPTSTYTIQPNYDVADIGLVVNGIPQPVEYYILQYGESITVESDYIRFTKQNGIQNTNSKYIGTNHEINPNFGMLKDYEGFITFLKPNKYTTADINFHQEWYLDGYPNYLG